MSSYYNFKFRKEARGELCRFLGSIFALTYSVSKIKENKPNTPFSLARNRIGYIRIRGGNCDWKEQGKGLVIRGSAGEVKELWNWVKIDFHLEIDKGFGEKRLDA